jgi:hypothetical protein
MAHYCFSVASQQILPGLPHMRLPLQQGRSASLAKLGNTLIRVHPDKIFTTATQGRAQNEADEKPVYIRKKFEVQENIRMQSFQNTRIVIEFQDALFGDVDWVAVHPARLFSDRPGLLAAQD